MISSGLFNHAHCLAADFLDMIRINENWLAHQRKRWGRPNAYLWIRPNADLWMRSDAHRRFAPAPLDACADGERKYSPDQPRVPAGNPDGGQWTIWSHAASVELSAARRGQGHHYVVRELFENLSLPQETEKVFEDATTGPLYDDRTNRNNREHRIYNQTVKELFHRFTEANDIEPQRMTPDEARRFLKEVQDSRDPRIRNLNIKIHLREIMFRLLRAPLRNE
jgi:hypothetical protein